MQAVPPDNPSTFFSSVEEFVTFGGGDHAIKKILIANNGIGATKAIRSIRKWAFQTFGNERTIEFVVMATPEDMKANAEYIRLADEVVDVPGGTNNNNYANINLICEIATRHRVDAVMPMWGHASENPNLPNSLLKLPHKVTFIGPSAAPMQALGDKIGSTIIAQSAGVPVIAWNGDDLRVKYQDEGIPQTVYDQANVITAEDALKCCERIGYPVMIKASEGGGGKGIRKVTRAEDVLSSYRAVQGEIPGSPIFVMKMASCARHLEVQLLADKYGDAIALSGRDCSVQRRHQKIIEEGPPTAAPPSVFKQMEKAAVALAKTVGYCSAGTVEYLYMEDTQEFAFLELNPRLQVEHPVTENILGLNLPACQLQVAMGIPLHRIADIRKIYGRPAFGRDTIDFEYTEKLPLNRHCMAVRVTAENPDASFQPSSGLIKELHFFSAIDVWGYFSVNNSGLIHEFADSQFGHIFASGTTREDARKAMITALKELQIRGEIRTTVEYIVKMLQSKDFVENKIDTMWLDGRLARHVEVCKEENAKFCPAPSLVALCGAALQGFKHFEKCGSEFVSMLRVGQVPSKDTLSPVVTIDLIFNNVKFGTTCTQSGPQSVIVDCNGGRQNVNIRPLSDGGYLMNLGGKSHVAYSQPESGGNLRIILDGHTCVFTPEYDPTRLTSSVAGKLARLLVEDGSHVQAGEPYVEIEVMKMYMPLKASEAGTVHFQMSEGATLTPGDVIALCKLDEPDKVVKAERFTGTLTVPNQLFLAAAATTAGTADPSGGDGESSAALPHILKREAYRKITQVLEGFPVPEEEVDEALTDYFSSFSDKLLPVYEVEEAISVLRGRIDADLTDKILKVNARYKDTVLQFAQQSAFPRSPIKSSQPVEYPSAAILSALHSFALTLPADKRGAFVVQTSTIWNAAEQYLYSVETRLMAALLKLVEEYLNVEKQFDNMSFTDVVTELRKDNMESLDKVLVLCRSHINIKAKNSILIKIMEEMTTVVIPAAAERPILPNSIPIRNEIHTRNLKIRLTAVAKLRASIYSHVSLNANLLLMKQFQMKPEHRRQRMNEAIVLALTTGEAIGQGDRLNHIKKFIESNIIFRDLLVDALHLDKDYQIAAMELYLHKTYQSTHNLSNFVCGPSLSTDGLSNSPWISFQFQTKHVAGIDSGNGTGGNLTFSDLTSLSAAQARKAESLSSEADSKDLRHRIVYGNRVGVIAAVDGIDDLNSLFPLICKKVPLKPVDKAAFVNAIHVVILRHAPGESSSSLNRRQSFGSTDDDDVSTALGHFLLAHKDNLKARGVRRVTFFVGLETRNHTVVPISDSAEHAAQGVVNVTPLLFTFRSSSDYAEDRLFRHIEAPQAFHLDLPRLANFNVSLDGVYSETSSGNVFLYKATPRSAKVGPRRYFARLLSYTADLHSNDAESLFVEALDHLGLAIGQDTANNNKASGGANHIFLNVVAPDSVIQPDFYDTELRRICNKYWYKMVRLAVGSVEFKISCKLAASADPVYLRLVASNPTGFVLDVDQYFEAEIEGKTVFKSIGEVTGPWNALETSTPYEISQKFEQQRADSMNASDTLYVYDWPVLFGAAVKKGWETFAQEKSGHITIPSDIFSCTELVLCDAQTREPLPRGGWNDKIAEGAVLLPVNREPGLNDVGMVAWIANLRTPECPEGRELVIISNDITHQAGSFGTKEDMLFFKASEYARVRGLPRFFLTANSGARIGMAQSLKNKFQVSWTDENDPSKGYKYIYMSQADYDYFLAKVNGDVSALPVICSPVDGPDGTTRYMITDIIGEESDLGVENLMGSGLIAGETARAYDEIFTLTLVVGRTVGIGAYLVRLGQRTIQKKNNAPIILTGYQALNKLMGREIYTTNDQLGGPMIMYPNGVSHLLAETHFDAVNMAVTWLSFVPAKKGAPLPLRDITGIDSIERRVDFAPQKGLTYDPRLLFTGLKLSEYEWQSGFFDKNSFIEALAGWAKTVVVGRGRLGGIPIGVIVTENRTAEATKPADPADMTSQEKLVQQAGGVWFPDSAYKTAQALRDFNREGLPCIVFANWRGFSGGQRDMFDEVLKFGSMIVDALVAYQQPLFVYIPPFAELRGGAWVVVDSTINADVMEFYAAEDARGGVLEATGAAAIKFRDRDIIATSHRIDPTLIALDAQLKTLKTKSDEEPDSDTVLAEIKEIEKQIRVRERLLFGVYQQVAVHFADLHDTPGRMRAKGVIRRQVQWAESRKFFYWRLRRRTIEFDVAKRLAGGSAAAAAARGFRKEAVSDLQRWFNSVSNEPERWDDDRAMVTWFTAYAPQLEAYITEKRAQTLAVQIGERLSELSAGAASGGGAPEDIGAMKDALRKIPAADRAVLLQALKDLA